MLKQVFVFSDTKTHIFNQPDSYPKTKSSKQTHPANPKEAETKMKVKISNKKSKNKVEKKRWNSGGRVGMVVEMYSKQAVL